MKVERDTLRILLVDGDSTYAGLVVESLQHHASGPVTVTMSSRADDAVARLGAGGFDAIVLDPDLPDSYDLSTVRRVAASAGGSPIIILTSASSETTKAAALREGADEYLAKQGLELGSLSTMVRRAIGRRAYGKALRALESPSGQERFRLLADNIKEAFIIVEMPHGRSLYVSQKWEDMWGRRVNDAYADPLVWFEAIHPDDRPKVAAIIAALPAGEGMSSTFRIQRPDGTVRWVRGRVFPVVDEPEHPQRLAVLVEDITEQRHTEEQLCQAQKMEAVGRLAGGVAHDFNNLLIVIDGYADMVAQELEPSHRAQNDLAEIRNAAKRAASLTSQLLAFSRRQILQPQILDPNQVLRRVEALLRRVIGEDITLSMRLSEPLGRVSADPGQIEQVIINLAINARDAMADGGLLTIETATVEFDAEYAARHPGATTGEHVMIAVSDTGVGMDEATQRRLFEPFFTTKPVGRGTGLGLATVYGIVKQSQGSIWVYSEPGRGTTFKIYLPAVGGLPSPVTAPPTEGPPLVGTETVLLVEDQAEVRGLIQKTLARIGYRVLVAGDGAEALELARSHDGPVHVLLTDVVLPGTSGRVVARGILAERADVRVLYMSGYTDDGIVRHGVLEPGLAFIQKPFSAEALLRKIREVLSAQSPPAP
jgi:PAS domain S-box-containing protein